MAALGAEEPALRLASNLLLLALGCAGALLAQLPDPHAELGAALEKAHIGNPASIEAGQQLYLTVCSGCHGVNAEGGRGPNLITSRNLQRQNDQWLFGVIQKGIPGSDMPPSSFEDEKVWQLAAFLRNLSSPAARQKVPGDPDAGRQVYYGAGRCMSCHMIRGEGGFLGPDLTNIGVIRTLTEIQEGVLDPNKRFSRGYMPVRVTLKNGETIRGVARNTSNYSIQLLDADGHLRLLSKSEVTQVEFPPASWMPADYGTRLSKQQVTDLLAFLSRQSVRPLEIAEGAAQ
jgi:putative heme-binding domain-containing protein